MSRLKKTNLLHSSKLGESFSRRGVFGRVVHSVALLRHTPRLTGAMSLPYENILVCCQLLILVELKNNFIYMYLRTTMQTLSEP